MMVTGVVRFKVIMYVDYLALYVIDGHIPSCPSVK